MSLQRELRHPHVVGCCPPTFPPVPRILGWASLWTWPGPPSGSWIPILGTRGHTVFDTLSVCVLAAVPSQGELGGRKSSPPEPDPAPEPAEPDASRAEHREQGAVPRGAEAVHVRACGPCRHPGPGCRRHAWRPGGKGTCQLTSISSGFSLGWF